MTKRMIIAISLSLMMIFSHLYFTEPASFAAGSLSLFVDGKDVTVTAAPIIKNSRTLVPLRVISEELGADVTWDAKDRTVEVIKGDTYIKLKIGSRLIAMGSGGQKYFLSDVAPVIINSSTYVPLRLLANMLGIEVGWSDAKKQVSVNSTKPASFTPFYDVKIAGISQGQTVSAGTALKISASAQTMKNAKEVKYIIFDADTYKGDVVARGSKLADAYSWLPKVSQGGKKVLIAGLYDSKGDFIAGEAVAVNVNVQPKISIKGIAAGQTITGQVSLNPTLNFIASYIKLQVINLDKGTSTTTAELDPYAPISWTPQYSDKGNVGFKLLAYDENGKAYESEVIEAKAEVTRKLTLSGVKKGQSIDSAVSLLASRNFNVTETEYFFKDKATGKETLIAKIPYGSYTWFPGPELSGEKDVYVRVKDGAGNFYTSPAVSVKLPGKAKIALEGIGPKQIVTGDVKLKVTGNIKPDKVNYILTDVKTGDKKTIGADISPTTEFNFKPTSGGDYQIQAETNYNGSKILSEKISFKIYLAKTYGPKPIVEKSKFQSLASDLAKSSWKKTGMSAALQTAQAILESGWGQSIPVDKYSGKFSYNLFGIKGKGSAGSVVSNTWEEYSGQIYRIEADFRAYKSIDESWNDHKKLLLEKERYGIFRDVMHDSTLGAWAIKRAGYATDSKYPIKLMNLIKEYNLQELDKVTI